MYEKIAKDSENSKDSSILTSLDSHDLESINNIKSYFMQKYKIDEDSLLSVLKGRALFEHLVPVSIFSVKICFLEAVVKYLKENLSLKTIEIANILQRSPTTISTTYKNSKKKYGGKFSSGSSSSLLIPLSVFSFRKLSPFESLVMYLNVFHKKKFSEIGNLIHRDSRVVWQIHKRAISKIGFSDYKEEFSFILSRQRKTINKEDLEHFYSIKKKIVERYDLSKKSFFTLLKNVQVSGYNIPLSIFYNNISPLRAVIKYLHEVFKIPLKDISKILNRSFPLISESYSTVKDLDMTILDLDHFISTDKLTDRRFSIMESVVSHLFSEKELTLSQISNILRRHTSVIWKFKDRYEKKNG